MGRSRDLGELAGKLAALEVALDGVTRATHQRIGREAKTGWIPVAAGRAVGGDLAMSNFGRGRRRGAIKLTAGYDADERRVEIRPRPPGPWALVEDGAKRHVIPRRRSIRRSRSGKTRVVNGVKLPDGGIRPFVVHPGVRGKRAWSDARRMIVAHVPDVTADEVRKALQRVMR